MGLIRILLFVVAAVLAYVLFRRLLGRGGAAEDPHGGDERLGRLVQDPNCRVYVDSREAVRRKVPDGELFFCSEACARDYMEKARDRAGQGG